MNADGTLSNGRMFFEGVGTGVIEEGIPDGMKCDERGNIWVTGPKGVWVISSAGEHLGTIEVPENVGNHHLGRQRLAHALHPVDELAVLDPHEGRPATRAVHALRPDAAVPGGHPKWPISSWIPRAARS